MLSRRWRLLAPLSSMSTSHRGDHICTHRFHHCLHCLACCSRSASAAALTPQRKDLHVGRGLCTPQWYIVSALCSISTIEKASLLRHSRQRAMSLLQILGTVMATKVPSLWVPIQRADSVCSLGGGTGITLRCARLCRTKYYGVHLGEPDIAATPFKDEPLMIHRSVQQSASLLRILQEASLMLYMTPCRPIRELLHQATAIIC